MIIRNKKFLSGILCGTLLGAAAAGIATYVLTRPVSGVPLTGREEGVSIGDKGNAVDTLRYTHPRYGFSLDFPKELAIGRYPEGNASETLVFQKAGDKVGFQIFVTPYVGEEITKDRLQKDVKGGQMEEPTEVLIGKNKGIRALIFWSEDPLAGRLREVWFIHDGFLYEVTTYADLDPWLAQILQTLSFDRADS